MSDAEAHRDQCSTSRSSRSRCDGTRWRHCERRLRLRSNCEARHASTDSDLLAFFADRLKVHLRDKGARHDLIDAMFALGGPGRPRADRQARRGAGRVPQDRRRRQPAGRRQARQQHPRDEEKKDKKSHAGAADAALLREPQEMALAAAIQKVKADTVAAINVENFAGAMRALAELRAPVDAFFDKVTVNARRRRRCAPTAWRCCPRSAPPPSTSPTSPRSPANRHSRERGARQRESRNARDPCWWIPALRCAWRE